MRALVFAEEATATLACALERQALLERSAEGERNLVESSERRLARLGLDLHDGPLQELAAFAGDLHLLRRQLARVIAANEHGDIVLGRIDDLEARLVELDRELRELAISAESSSLMATSFPELLTSELQAFAVRHEIEPKLAARSQSGLGRIGREAADEQQLARRARRHLGGEHLERVRLVEAVVQPDDDVLARPEAEDLEHAHRAARAYNPFVVPGR